jgi:serine/threonine protein kinase
MELLEGNDLEHELGRLEARGERLEMDRVFEIFDAIVETLERAHAAGILHRDLKPANIYLLSPDAGGGVRLLDFGLSRMKSAAPLTVLGTVLGSPSYIAPEVWAGKTDVLDQRVDVYSLAVLLYRVLSGKMPFEGETLHEKFLQATTASRPRLTTVRPDLPPAVDAWVEQALAIDPARRFPSAAALWSALLSAMRYAPPARPRIAVPESVVSAWRAAAGAFRRILSGAGTPPPPKPSIPGLPSARPRSLPPSAAPRTAPPPPPVRPRKPLEVNAEWLLDTDVLVAEDSLQFSRLDVAGSRAPSALVAALSRRGRRKQPHKTAASERGAREERKQRRRRRARAGGRRA